MKKRIYYFKFIFNLLVSYLLCLSSANALPNCLSNTISNQLRALVEASKQQFKIPGMLAGVWIPGKGQLVIENGLADINANRPIDERDAIRIGSITKSFVVTVILQLVQEGRINLNEPVKHFLPKVQNGDATIAQLANMRSGIYNYTEDQTFFQKFLKNLLQRWNPQTLVDIADRNHPYFPPNVNWHYSNTNSVILGMIIEKVTGHSLGEEINNRIIKPLALKNTVYPTTPNLSSPFARGYSIKPIADLTLVDPTASAGSGAMISTLKDLHQWAIALGKGTLLTPTMQQLRINSLTPVVFNPCADTDPNRVKVTCPEYDKYGLGLGEIEGWIGHTGEYIGYTSLIMYEPASGAVVVLIANTFDLGEHVPTKLFRKFVAVLNPLIHGMPRKDA